MAGGQNHSYMPSYTPPPINIQVVTGNDNKIVPTKEDKVSQEETFKQDPFEKPMIKQLGGEEPVREVSLPRSVSDNNALETLGMGRGNFIVKKI
jgi:hypothetical protein